MSSTRKGRKSQMLFTRFLILTADIPVTHARCAFWCISALLCCFPQLPSFVHVNVEDNGCYGNGFSFLPYLLLHGVLCDPMTSFRDKGCYLRGSLTSESLLAAWLAFALYLYFVFVLMGWSLLPNVQRAIFLNIHCAPPNLNIRTWICRLNFAHRPMFSGLRFLTSLKSQTQDPQLKLPPRGLVLRIFTSWKSLSTSVGFEPANLGSRGEHVTPRPPRPT